MNKCKCESPQPSVNSNRFLDWEAGKPKSLTIMTQCLKCKDMIEERFNITPIQEPMYLLLGEAVSKAYLNEGCAGVINAVRDDEEMYDLIEVIHDGTNESLLDIMDKATDGWLGWIAITKEDYDELMEAL